MKEEADQTRAAEDRVARRNMLILFGGTTLAMIAMVVAAVLFYPA
jgi:hypothetical protein